MCTRTFICNSSPRDVSTDNSFVFVTVRNKPAAKESSGESGRERTGLFTETWLPPPTTHCPRSGRRTELREE